MRRLLVLLPLTCSGCLMPDGVQLGIYSGNVAGSTTFDPADIGGEGLPELVADTDLGVEAAVVTFSWSWTERRIERRLERLEQLLTRQAALAAEAGR